MYAIIYWKPELAEGTFFFLNPIGTIKTFDNLKEADKAAYLFEEKYLLDARVISLEPVHE